MEGIAPLALLTAIALIGGGAAEPSYTQVEPKDLAAAPTRAQINAAYPDGPGQYPLIGMATVGCRVGVSGRLNNCVVLSELYYGLGYGAAALRLAKDYLLRDKGAWGGKRPDRVQYTVVFGEVSRDDHMPNFVRDVGNPQSTERGEFVLSVFVERIILTPGTVVQNWEELPANAYDGKLTPAELEARMAPGYGALRNATGVAHCDLARDGALTCQPIEGAFDIDALLANIKLKPTTMAGPPMSTRVMIRAEWRPGVTLSD